MGSLNGNDNIQFIELRMNVAGQTLLSGHTIEFYDGGNTIVATFTFPASPSVSNASVGDSILIATEEFNALSAGGDADYTFEGNTTGSAAENPVQVPNGRIHFSRGFDNCMFGLQPGDVDAVAYGTATALWGDPAEALSTDTNALRLDNLMLDPTDNSDEYTLEPVADSTFGVAPGQLSSDLTSPRNNQRVVVNLLAPPSVGGVDRDPPVQVAGLPLRSPKGDERSIQTKALNAIAVAVATTAVGVFAIRRGTS